MKLNLVAKSNTLRKSYTMELVRHIYLLCPQKAQISKKVTLKLPSSKLNQYRRKAKKPLNQQKVRWALTLFSNFPTIRAWFRSLL